MKDTLVLRFRTDPETNLKVACLHSQHVCWLGEESALLLTLCVAELTVASLIVIMAR